MIVLVILVAVALVAVWTVRKKDHWIRFFRTLKPSIIKENYREVMRKGARTDRDGVISYSLYGNYEKYLPQLLNNLEAVRDRLPRFQARVYLAHTIPPEVRARMLELGAEVVVMPALPGHGGALWRFLPGTEGLTFVSLDADDTFDCEESVRQWMQSDNPFLLLFHGGRLIPMKAGLWGARGGVLLDIQERMEKWQGNWYGYDEEFLKKEIYPLVKRSGYFNSNILASSPYKQI